MADKKILDEEILSDDELEQVTGGTSSQTQDLFSVMKRISRFDKYFQKSQYGGFYLSEIKTALKKEFNIEAYLEDGRQNVYLQNGEKAITHSELMTVLSNIVKIEELNKQFFK